MFHLPELALDGAHERLDLAAALRVVGAAEGVVDQLGLEVGAELLAEEAAAPVRPHRLGLAEPPDRLLHRLDHRLGARPVTETVATQKRDVGGHRKPGLSGPGAEKRLS
ncbi:MAG TPA: hypothetical protein RMH99_17345 [Sandaracinaceae bacterium LLY-WYZ-13_1]|nr:hypothetical protein [Sandaracinaceae bacterium LLY-WYZ-13_1]